MEEDSGHCCPPEIDLGSQGNGGATSNGLKPLGCTSSSSYPDRHCSFQGAIRTDPAAQIFAVLYYRQIFTTDRNLRQGHRCRSVATEDQDFGLVRADSHTPPPLLATLSIRAATRHGAIRKHTAMVACSLQDLCCTSMSKLSSGRILNTSHRKSCPVPRIQSV